MEAETVYGSFLGLKVFFTNIFVLVEQWLFDLNYNLCTGLQDYSSSPRFLCAQIDR